MVDAKCAQFYGDYLQANLANVLRSDGNINSTTLFNLSVSKDMDTGPLLCALMGGQIKASLSKMIDSLDYEPGIPQQERDNLRKKLDTEIQALEREEEAMIVKAESMGLSIVRHPEVVLEVERAA